MENVGLVLEGGGFRGAYTAGALCWLIDHNLNFDYACGISAGAVHLCSFLAKRKDYLHDFSVDYLASDKVVGIKPLLSEGGYVGYSYMFDTLLRDKFHFNPSAIETNTYMEIGAYDLAEGVTKWYHQSDLKPDMKLVKAACTIPIAGKKVLIDGKYYIDGGMTTMVPVKKSIEYGNKKHLIIITKDASYVRKPVGKAELLGLKLIYHKFPKVVNSYSDRTGVYYEEMNLVARMEEEGTALLLRPSKAMGVGRFKGTKEQLEAMFQLGYQDQEDRKEQIYKFLEIEG